MKYQKPKLSKHLLAAGATLTIIACSTTPQPNQRFSNAESSYQSMKSIPGAEQAAGIQVSDAEQAYIKARTAWQEGADKDQVDYLASLAESKAETASAIARRRLTQDNIDASGAERDRLLIESKERDAIKADAERRRTERANAQLRAEAEAAQEVASRATRKASALAGKMKELEAKETERGTVVTLDGVLFESGSAALKPGANRKLSRLIKILMAEPDAKALIEGFTDSSGSEQGNLRLSQLRADSVRRNLIRQGVSAERLQAHGLGESFPVASNEQAAGRQQNRRVEIVLSDAPAEISRRR